MTTQEQRHDVAREHAAAAPSPRGVWYLLMLVGGLVGGLAAGWSTVERIAYAENPTAASFCEINSVISCNSIFSHWQSAALGVPNTLVSLPVFALLASAGLAGLLGSRLSRAYLAAMFGLTIFMSAFVTWYMHQSAFSIGALCLFCTIGAAALITVGVGVTRAVDAAQALGTGAAGRRLRLLVDANADLILWVGLAALIAVLLFLGLG